MSALSPAAQNSIGPSLTAAVLFAYLALAHVGAFAQPRYTVDRVGPDPVKGSARGIALNDLGQVVGEYCPAPVGRCQPFVFHDGRLDLIDLDIPDAIHARALLITNQGLVAGTYQTEGRRGPMKVGSFLYQNGRLNPFQPPWPLNGFRVYGLNDRGDAFGFASGLGEAEMFIYLGGQLRFVKTDQLAFSARALNQVGQIAGGSHGLWPRSDGAADFRQPYVMTKETTLRLKPDAPGSVSVESVAALNNHGHIVGQAHSPRGFQAFVAKASEVEVLDVQRDESRATDINDRGTIVGFRYNHPLFAPGPGGRVRADAFLWSDGKVDSLDRLVGMTIDHEHPLRINQRGQILVNVRRQAYLLTPTAR